MFCRWSDKYTLPWLLFFSSFVNFKSLKLLTSGLKVSVSTRSAPWIAYCSWIVRRLMSFLGTKRAFSEWTFYASLSSSTSTSFSIITFDSTGVWAPLIYALTPDCYATCLLWNPSWYSLSINESCFGLCIFIIILSPGSFRLTASIYSGGEIILKLYGRSPVKWELLRNSTDLSSSVL